MPVKNKKILCLTEGTVRSLAREMGIPKVKLTPDVMEELRVAVLNQFEEWDNWLKELIADTVGADN